MKYTYSDEEDDIYSDSTTARRSTRNTGTHTPAEPSGPTITQSGRQVKSRHGGAYGESILSETHGPAISAGGFDGTSEEPEGDGNGGRPRRAAAAAAAATNGWAPKGGRHIEGYNDVDEMTSDDEGDASEQDYGDDEEEEDHVSLGSDVDDPDDLTEDEDLDEVGEKKLIVKLPVKTPTPEKKTTAKLRMTPEKDSPKPSALFPSTVRKENASTSNSTTANRANPTAVDTKENAKPTSIQDSASTPTKPMSVPPKSPPHQTQTAPLSPLAFRGSPEKLPAFPPSVDVAFGGT
jgi:hypothetical protein